MCYNDYERYYSAEVLTKLLGHYRQPKCFSLHVTSQSKNKHPVQPFCTGPVPKQF